jgi:hypothetical protein
MMLKHIRKEQNTNDSPTVFHVTHYKSGSQWVYAVLNEVSDQRIIKPEVAAHHVTKRPVVSGGVYPCVYLTREELFACDLPKNIRIFIIIRDLRDTLVSQYFSVKHSHPMMDSLQEQLRDMLNSVDISDGLIHMMKRRLKTSAEIQKSWIHSDHLLVRYEDLNSDEHSCFRKIISYCDMEIPEKALKDAVEKHSFEKRAGRKPGEEDVASHHRKGIIGDWRNYFDSRVTEEFKRRYGDALVETGYEKDQNWNS